MTVLLGAPGIVQAVRSGGFDPASRKLEIAFKVAGGARDGSKDGCYPRLGGAVGLIRHWAHLKAKAARGFGRVIEPDVVYVIASRSSCERMVFALLHDGDVLILDTAAGDVYRRGQSRQTRGAEAARLGRGPLRALSLIGRTFGLDTPDRARRLVIRCPSGSSPLGGAMSSDPPVGADGEGVYPHSYERLGVQRGFHVTALIIDPSPGETTPREASLQAVCGRGLVPMSAPHRTVYVPRGGANTAVAACPPGQLLFSGGFQRTNFTTPFLTWGGNYITESRAISPTAWEVSSNATGWDGGELTAIAYCARDPSLPLTQVETSMAVEHGGAATATTPPCPVDQELIAGGFSLSGSGNALIGNGSFNQDGSWSTTAFGYFGSAPSLTAYGYCLSPADEPAAAAQDSVSRSR